MGWCDAVAVTDDPRPAQVEWLRAAARIVQRDLDATLADGRQLHIQVEDDGDDEYEARIAYELGLPPWLAELRAFVADQYGTYSSETPLYGDSEWGAGSSVAQAVQDELAKFDFVVWPLCPRHRFGVHVQPAGRTDRQDLDEPGPDGPPAWWCRGGGGHDLALVGHLS